MDIAKTAHKYWMMIVHATSPSFSAVCQRWQDYHCDLVDIQTQGFTQWCWSLDRLTWQFYHCQLEQAVEKNTRLGHRVKQMIRKSLDNQ